MKFNRLIFIVIGLIIHNLSYAQQWFDSNWYYRTEIAVNNTSNNDLSDYQVNISLNQSNFDFSRCRSDGGDIRFADSDGSNLIPFWIENWTINSANIWVKVPFIVANGESKLYLYCGNPEATSASNGENTFIYFDDFEKFNKTGMNALQYLNTPTYDGSGQATHPDILFIPNGWNGYRYWMVMTPYPNSNDEFENPSVIVSNDNVYWHEPSENINPLAPTPSGDGWNNDVDILLVNNNLVLYYNETNEDGYVYLKRMVSNNGVDWSMPLTVLIIPKHVLSPAVLFENNTYYMWYLRSGGCFSPSQNVYLRESSDGINWGLEQNVSLVLPGYVPWHFDIQKDGANFIMLFVAYPENTDCLEWGMSLYYAESTDGLNWTANSTSVLSPSESNWDNRQIYRSTFIKENSTFRIWYSANSTDNEWRIGYTEGELNEFISPDPHWDEINGAVSASTDYNKSGIQSLKELGGSTSPQIFKNITGRFSFNAWYYDRMDTPVNLEAILRIWDSGNITFPLHAIGVGSWMGQSTSNYVYHSEDLIYFDTIISRSLGWHKLSINVKENICDLLIDDSLVGSLAVLDESAIARISLEGRDNGTTYFDDVFVRSYSTPEPSITFGEDISLAIGLVSLSGKSIKRAIKLEWRTASEIDNQGFIIYKREEHDINYSELSSYKYNQSLIGAGNSSTGDQYSYTDSSVINGKTYWYRLVDIDINGISNEHPPISVTYNSSVNDRYPDQFVLFQNHPNPFNPSTTIEYKVPKSSIIKIEIYNTLGQNIKTLVDFRQDIGSYSVKWDGTDNEGNIVTGGQYFYLMKIDNQTEAKKMLFLK